jgi:hypothetical protein
VKKKWRIFDTGDVSRETGNDQRAMYSIGRITHVPRETLLGTGVVKRWFSKELIIVGRERISLIKAQKGG